MDVSKVRKKIRDLGLERFKAEMEMLRDLSRKKMLYGSVIKKYKACGKGGCKCTRGALHGPFYYLTYKEEGKTKMIFVKKNLWEVAIKLNNNYRKWRKLRADISKIGKEILTLLDEIEKEGTVKLSQISIADSNE
jgi:formylmethanofuran dehydrogenase subunit E